MLDKIFTKYACVKKWAGPEEHRKYAVPSIKEIDGTNLAVIAFQGVLYGEDGTYLDPVETLASSIVGAMQEQDDLPKDFVNLSREIKDRYQLVPYEIQEQLAETEIHLVGYSHDAVFNTSVLKF